MKKIVRCLMLIMVLIGIAGLVVGCGVSSDGKENPTEPFIEETLEESVADAAVVSIEEQILVDQDGIRITAAEYVTDSFQGDGIKVFIENKTENNLGVSCKQLIVNDYMIDNVFGAWIDAGSNLNEVIYFFPASMEAAGIEKAGKIEVSFRIYDIETFDPIFETDMVTIHTSVFERMDSTPDDSGTELYAENGVRIVSKSVELNSLTGAQIGLYLENNTDRNIKFYCDTMTINGIEVTPFLLWEVYSGKMAFTDLEVMGTEIEEKNITSIDEIELSFSVKDIESSETLFKTDTIAFTVE